MKRILSVMALLVIGMGTDALASQFNVFVGGNGAAVASFWNHDLDSELKNVGISLPDFYGGVGAEVGLKFRPIEDYGVGLTANYDYIFNSKAKISDSASDVISDARVGFSMYGISLDNYLFNALIVGVGYDKIKMRQKINMKAGDDEKQTETTNAIVIKLGEEVGLTDSLSLNSTVRGILPADKDAVKFGLMVTVGVRYNF